MPQTARETHTPRLARPITNADLLCRCVPHGFAMWILQAPQSRLRLHDLGIVLCRRLHKRCGSCRSRLAACMLCTARRASAHLCVPEEQEGTGAVTTAAWARSDGIVTAMRSHARGRRSGITRAREMRWMCGLRVRETNRKTACGVENDRGRICKIHQVKSETFVLRVAVTAICSASRDDHARRTN